jgi:hypothetical protein
LEGPAIGAPLAQLNVYPVECLPNGMRSLFHRGNSLFNWGEALFDRGSSVGWYWGERKEKWKWVMFDLRV